MSWQDQVKDIDREVSNNNRKEFEVIPDGEYLVCINKAEIVDEGPSPYVGWEFEILEGKFTKRRLWIRSYLTPKAYPILRRLIEEDCGFMLDEPSQLEPSLEEIANENWVITVTSREYNDKTYYNLNGFKPVDESKLGASEEIPF